MMCRLSSRNANYKIGADANKEIIKLKKTARKMKINYLKFLDKKVEILINFEERN